MSNKVFGTSSLPKNSKPTRGRSSTIEFSKKAISYFMPNKLMKWDLESNCRNPKKSAALNKFIKRMKEHKVRKEGVASKAWHDMELPEFLKIVKRCRMMSANHFGRLTGSISFSFSST